MMSLEQEKKSLGISQLDPPFPEFAQRIDGDVVLGVF
jgi:hypothetical protein